MDEVSNAIRDLFVDLDRLRTIFNKHEITLDVLEEEILTQCKIFDFDSEEALHSFRHGIKRSKAKSARAKAKVGI